MRFNNGVYSRVYVITLRVEKIRQVKFYANELVRGVGCKGTRTVAHLTANLEFRSTYLIRVAREIFLR